MASAGRGACREEKSITLMHPTTAPHLHSQPREQPWPCGRAVHDAASYLVSSRSLLVVGTLQEPRLFGKFI